MFKLIRFLSISGYTEEIAVHEGEVDVFPATKYLYDEEDPTNKRRRIRFGKYSEAEIECRFVCDYAKFKQVAGFLKTSDLVANLDIGLGLYILFYDGDDSIHAYPVFDIAEQPEMRHDDRFFTQQHIFKLKSVYIEHPHLPTFLNYGTGNYGGEFYGY